MMRDQFLARRGRAVPLALLLDMLCHGWRERFPQGIPWLAPLILGGWARTLPGSPGLWAEAGLLCTCVDWSRTRREALAQVRAACNPSAPGARTSASPGRSEPAHTANDLPAVTLARQAAEGTLAPLLCYVAMGLPGAAIHRLLASSVELLPPLVSHMLVDQPRRIAQGALALLVNLVGGVAGKRCGRPVRTGGLSPVENGSTEDQTAVAAPSALALAREVRLTGLALALASTVLLTAALAAGRSTRLRIRYISKG